MQRVAILALDGAHLSSIGTIEDVVALTSRYRAIQYGGHEIVPTPTGVTHTQISLLTLAGAAINLSSGRHLTADGPIQAARGCNAVFLPDFEIPDMTALEACLASAQPIYPLLRAVHAEGTLLAASGVATFLLAESGLLDRRLATTPWWLEQDFRRRYPHVALDTARTLTVADRIYCSGTLQSDLLLAVRLVGQISSPGVADWVQKMTFADTYLYSPRSWTGANPGDAPPDPLVARAQFWLQERFSQKVRIAELARSLAVSERTLLRRFERSLGVSPQTYLQRLRIEAAKQMLARSAMRVDRIAGLVGYNDTAFFKRVFLSHTGELPSRFRAASRSALKAQAARV